MATSPKQALPGRRVQWGAVAFDRVDEAALGQLGFKNILVLPAQGLGEETGISFPVSGSSSRRAWQERWYCLFQACRSPPLLLVQIFTSQMFTYQPPGWIR